MVGAFSFYYFRRQNKRRTHSLSANSQALTDFKLLRFREVSNSQDAISINEDIEAFEVSVDYLVSVDMEETGSQLHEEFPQLRL